jgi:tetratricopeptide (TPR) repeat protein
MYFLTRLMAVSLAVLAGSLPAHAQNPQSLLLQRAIDAYDAGELTRAAAILDSIPAGMAQTDRALGALYHGLIDFASGDMGAARSSFRRAIELDPTLRLDPAVHAPNRVSAFVEARDSVVAGWQAEARRTYADGEWQISFDRYMKVSAALPSDAEAETRLVILRNRLNIPDPDSVDPPIRSADPAPADAAALPADLRLYSPGGAMALGMLLPGLGEFYTGRAGRGLLYLLGAGGAAAAGALYTNVSVRCLSVPVNGVCPQADVASEDTERPYLGYGLAAAGVLTFIGAIDAMIGASEQNERTIAAARARSGQGAHLEPPMISATGRDLRLAILRIRF